MHFQTNDTGKGEQVSGEKRKAVGHNGGVNNTVMTQKSDVPA